MHRVIQDCFWQKVDGAALQLYLPSIITRFELARAEPIGLAVQRLNHSAI